MKDIEMFFNAKIDFEEYCELYSISQELMLIPKILKGNDENKALVAEMNDIAETIASMLERFDVEDEDDEKKESEE